MATDSNEEAVLAKRHEAYFDSVVPDKNGCLDLSEFMRWANDLEPMCQATDAKWKELRSSIQEFWATVGFVPGAELTREQFVHGMMKAGREELERQRKGEKTPFTRMMNAFFDVLDEDNLGYVTQDELEKFFRAVKTELKAAKVWSDNADLKQNGKLDRGELTKNSFNFWFNPAEDKTGGMLMAGAYTT
ncbi:predicted protein [Nematostella vectensis]|uniref:EF-hand domain-containing protein n=1 Tax=Nematostella vectensis TaxID=45351 RepID=A7RLF7_NEMVE|nr:mitrocomin [Nematostella vectensis]EDO47597.1 predicted protein [Nematostella vectensis]|eukprot:XP_001639660.1 predicted protein [Nematostella vectensis]